MGEAGAFELRDGPVPDVGGDDSDHEEKSEQGLSVKSLDNHQDLPSIVKEQMDELKTMTEQIKLAQRGKASFKTFTTCCILSILWQPSDKLSHICHEAQTANHGWLVLLECVFRN